MLTGVWGAFGAPQLLALAPVAYARGSERALPSRDRKGVGALKCLLNATPRDLAHWLRYETLFHTHLTEKPPLILGNQRAPPRGGEERES